MRIQEPLDTAAELKSRRWCDPQRTRHSPRRWRSLCALALRSRKYSVSVISATWRAFLPRRSGCAAPAPAVQATARGHRPPAPYSERRVPTDRRHRAGRAPVQAIRRELPGLHRRRRRHHARYLLQILHLLVAQPLLLQAGAQPGAQQQGSKGLGRKSSAPMPMQRTTLSISSSAEMTITGRSRRAGSL
jgi:hypothetical protein